MILQDKRVANWVHSLIEMYKFGIPSNAYFPDTVRLWKYLMQLDCDVIQLCSHKCRYRMIKTSDMNRIWHTKASVKFDFDCLVLIWSKSYFTLLNYLMAENTKRENNEVLRDFVQHKKRGFDSILQNILGIHRSDGLNGSPFRGSFICIWLKSIQKRQQTN